MTPDQARALYRASKKRTIRKQAVVAVQRAKADTRARAMIERWQAGETHSQIADALGVTRCCVTRAISRYRERHLISINPSDPTSPSGDAPRPAMVGCGMKHVSTTASPVINS